MPIFIIFLLALLALNGCGGGGGSSAANQEPVPVKIQVDLKQVASDETPANGEVVSQGVPSGEPIKGELRVFIPGSPPTPISFAAPLLLTPTAPSVTLNLGQGEYIFQVNITDESDTIVAFGEVSQAVGAGTSLFIPLTSIINAGTFAAPDDANPGETIDINIELKGPNDRLLVPEDDFEVNYTFISLDVEISPIATSKRGARVIMPCVPLTVDSIDITPLLSGLTQDSNGFFTKQITPFQLTNGAETFKAIMPASNCSNVNVGVDINAPVIVGPIINLLSVGETAQVVGYSLVATEQSLGDSGIARVNLYIQELGVPASRTLLATQEYPATPNSIGDTGDFDDFTSGDIFTDPTNGLLAFLKPGTQYDIFFQVIDGIGTSTFSAATSFTHNPNLSSSYPEIADSCADGYLLLSPALFSAFAGKEYERIRATGTAQFGGTTYISGTLSGGADPINDSFVVALRNDCTFNSNFNGNGIRLFSEADTDLQILDIAVDGSSGKVLIAGIKDPASDSPFGFIQRLNGDGSPDNSFGSSSIVTAAIAGSDEGFSSLALDASGNIYAGGYSGSLFSLGNYRLNAYAEDGSLLHETDNDTNPPSLAGIYDLALTANNELAAVGYNNSSSFLAKIDPSNGNILDTVDTSGELSPNANKIASLGTGTNTRYYVLTEGAQFREYDDVLDFDLESVSTIPGNQAGCFITKAATNQVLILNAFKQPISSATLKASVVELGDTVASEFFYPFLSYDDGTTNYGNNEMDNDGCVFDNNADEVVAAVNLRDGFAGSTRIAIIRFDLP